MRVRLLSLACAAWLTSTAALAADPCTAIPEHGPLPPYIALGKPFRGQVSHIIDGDGLCVATGNGPSTWVEVRLADFFAPELNEGGRAAKAALERLAMNRAIVCVPQLGFKGDIRTGDRIVARCQIGNRSVGDLMRGAGVREGGRAYRPRG